MKFANEKKSGMNDLVDEIVDEVLDSIQKPNVPSKEQAPRQFIKTPSRTDENFDDIAKLKNRVENLENRVEKYISNFKTSTMEVERELSERSGDLSKDNEKQIMQLQGQIEVLRTGMIRLGSELRRIRESLLRENLLK